MTCDATEAVRHIVDEGEDADEILRATVARLAEVTGVTWAGVAFVEQGALRLGPSAGMPDPAQRARTPIVFQGATVGELWLDGDSNHADADRIADLIAPLVLIGWDTGGDAWEP